MSERRFDPVGWFVSTCFAVLSGAVALTVAVHLVSAVWVWLLVGVAAVVTVGLGVQLVVWWHRRRPW
ncbi:MAG: hypothetical protein QM650_10565 [Microlunatus sp.]